MAGSPYVLEPAELTDNSNGEYYLSSRGDFNCRSTRRIVTRLNEEAMRRELGSYACWFAEHQAHQGLDGRTPNEVYDGPPACEGASQEQQKPKTIPRRELVVRYHEGRRQLPIVELRRAA